MTRRFDEGLEGRGEGGGWERVHNLLHGKSVMRRSTEVYEHVKQVAALFRLLQLTRIASSTSIFFRPGIFAATP